MVLPAMKALFTVLFCLGLPLIGADKKPLTKEESAKVIETAIRKAAKKPTGELTKTDLDKVTKLHLDDNQLSDLKGLEKLTQITDLVLYGNQLTLIKNSEAAIDRYNEISEILSPATNSNPKK